MKDLIIVCAGGYGKEVLTVAEGMNHVSPQWNILGFIDDTMEVGTEVFYGYKVIGGIKEWKPKEGQFFAMGHSNPQAKCKLYELLKSKGAQFATLISPGIYIPRDMEIGEGSVITLAWLGVNVKIGKCVNINGSMVGGSTIGDFSTTTGFANIAAAHLGKRVFVGSHAVVLNRRKVGDDANICAGSIVFKHVKAGTTVMGNPAVKIDF